MFAPMITRTKDLERRSLSRASVHINGSDHIHYCHGGASVTYHIVSPEGQYSVHRLGPNVARGEVMLLTGPGGPIKAAELTEGEFGLLGEVVAPGFDFNDFTFISENEIRSNLPKHDALHRSARVYTIAESCLGSWKLSMDAFDQVLQAARPASEWSFGVLMGFSALLYLVAHLAPRSLVRFNSVPWAFQLGRATDLRYQGVLYSAFHTRPWARFSHLSLAWEQPFWLALLYALHPAVAGAALLLLLMQALLLGSRKLAAVLMGTWVAIAAAGWGLVQICGEERTATLAMTVLLFGSLLRLSGHIREPIPPGILVAGRFVPQSHARPGLHILGSLLVGLVSEFAAGFPFRLFLVQVLWLSNALGLETPHHGGHEEHSSTAEQVHRGGWSASPVTAWMLEEEPGRLRTRFQSRSAGTPADLPGDRSR